jgi:hypothetical protein
LQWAAPDQVRDGKGSTTCSEFLMHYQGRSSLTSQFSFINALSNTFSGELLTLRSTVKFESLKPTKELPFICKLTNSLLQSGRRLDSELTGNNRVHLRNPTQ